MSARTSKWVCFDCRVCFHSRPGKCPCCREDMVCMGRSFRAPRRTNKSAWKRIQGSTRISRYNGYRWGLLLLDDTRSSKSCRRRKLKELLTPKHKRWKYPKC